MDRKTEIELQRYLDEIERELERLPRTTRGEIVAEIRSHLLEEWGRCGEQNRENMLHIMNNFGEPREIAAGYLGQRPGVPAPTGGVSSPPPTWLVLLLTVFLWPAGIILAWLSPAWRTRDKLVATLIPPLLFITTVALSMI